VGSIVSSVVNNRNLSHCPVLADKGTFLDFMEVCLWTSQWCSHKDSNNVAAASHSFRLSRQWHCCSCHRL